MHLRAQRGDLAEIEPGARLARERGEQVGIGFVLGVTRQLVERHRIGAVGDEVGEERAHPGVAGFRVRREPDDIAHGHGFGERKPRMLAAGRRFPSMVCLDGSLDFWRLHRHYPFPPGATWFRRGT